MSSLPQNRPSTADIAGGARPDPGDTPERRADTPERRADTPEQHVETPARRGDASERRPSMPERRVEGRENVRHIERPASGPRSPDPAGAEIERPGALLVTEEARGFRDRWDVIQTGFVDEPRRAVQDADSLVAETMKQVAEVFAREREGLERQWREGQNVSTEDLRVALKRYRSFFDRLLSV